MSPEICTRFVIFIAIWFCLISVRSQARSLSSVQGFQVSNVARTIAGFCSTDPVLLYILTIHPERKPDRFVVEYVVTRNGFHWAIPLIPFSILIVCLLRLFWEKNPLRKTIIIACMTFVAILFVAGSALSVWNYITGTSVYRHGRFSVIEGFVQNFRPLPQWVRRGQGSLKESFSVNGVTFSYHDISQVEGTCFQHSPWGDPIHEGIYVRIAYIDNCILRLEVASDDSH